jgi:hypothetical protein
MHPAGLTNDGSDAIPEVCHEVAVLARPSFGQSIASPFPPMCHQGIEELKVGVVQLVAMLCSFIVLRRREKVLPHHGPRQVRQYRPNCLP